MGNHWVSWNARGLNRTTKRMAVKKAFVQVRPSVVFLQEIKLGPDREKEIELV